MLFLSSRFAELEAGAVLEGPAVTVLRVGSMSTKLFISNDDEESVSACRDCKLAP